MWRGLSPGVAEMIFKYTKGHICRGNEVLLWWSLSYLCRLAEYRRKLLFKYGMIAYYLRVGGKHHDFFFS